MGPSVPILLLWVMTSYADTGEQAMRGAWAVWAVDTETNQAKGEVCGNSVLKIDKGVFSFSVYPQMTTKDYLFEPNGRFRLTVDSPHAPYWIKGCYRLYNEQLTIAMCVPGYSGPPPTDLKAMPGVTVFYFKRVNQEKSK